MRYLPPISFIIFAFVLATNCNNNKTESAYSSEINYQEDEIYSDGQYCALITYYNPNTGTRSNYDLTIEIEDGLLTVIHWPNGGWLDESHFTPEEVDENGDVAFTTDRGYQYQVHVESEGACTE